MEAIAQTNTTRKGRKNFFIKIIVGALIVSLAVGMFFTARYVLQLREYKKRIADIRISSVDLSKIPNGSYFGSYDAIMIAAKVRVHVSDHTITDIDLLYHKNERGKKAERIVSEIQSQQSLKVDTITGATNSSKVILKAVQNALNSRA
jgi:uncharacterized protein with FMN-binding domain